MKHYIALSLALLIPWTLHSASNPTRKSKTVKTLEQQRKEWPEASQQTHQSSTWKGIKQDVKDFTEEITEIFTGHKKSPKKFISSDAFSDGANQTPPDFISSAQDPIIPSDPLAISMVTAYQASKEHELTTPHVVITIDPSDAQKDSTQELPTIVLPEMQNDSIQETLALPYNEETKVPTQEETIALHSLIDSIDAEPTLTEAEQHFIKQNKRKKIYPSEMAIPKTPYTGKKYPIESSNVSEYSNRPEITFSDGDLQTTGDHIRSMDDGIKFSIKEPNKYAISIEEKTSEPLFNEYQLLLQDDSNTSASINTNAIDLREFSKNLTSEQKNILQKIHNYFFESEVSLRSKTQEQKPALLSTIAIPETAKTPTLLDALKAYTQITRELKNNCEEKIKILEKQFEIDTSTLFTTSGENKPTDGFLKETTQYKNSNKENLLKKRNEVIQAFANIKRAQRTIKNHNQLAAIRDDLSTHLSKTQSTASWAKTLGLHLK